MAAMEAGTQQQMNIALFGDLHGRLLLPFYLIRRWEQEHSEPIHLALSTGDAGIYRSLQHMEKTSQRWAKRYPEELGFSKLFFKFELRSLTLVRHPATDEVLGDTKADLWFVPGNHEDHAYLAKLWESYANALDQPVAVDRDWPGLMDGRYKEGQFDGYGRIFCLPQGRIVSLDSPLNEQTWTPDYTMSLLAVNGIDKYTAKEAWSTPGAPVQLMLTHDCYHGRLEGFDRTSRRNEYGSERLGELIRRVGPTYHFFGHHHYYYPEVELQNFQGGITRSVGLNQVFFDTRESVIKPGCFGILRVQGPEKMTFETVEDAWFRSLRYTDCRAYL